MASSIDQVNVFINRLGLKIELHIRKSIGENSNWPIIFIHRSIDNASCSKKTSHFTLKQKNIERNIIRIEYGFPT